MVNGIIVLLMIGIGLMMRIIYSLTFLFHGLKSMSHRKLDTGEIHQLKNRIIETVFLTFCLMTILVAVTLIAHQSVTN